MAGNPWRRAPSGRIIRADLVKNKLESDAPRAIASGFFEANTADAGTTRMIPLSGKLYTQPQTPVGIDWSNPLARGLVGLFDATTGFDLINGTRSTTNSTTISLVQKGKVGTFSNSVQEFPHTPKYAITGALTIFAPLVVTSLANYSGIISKSSNYVSFPFELRLGASATSSEIDFQRGNGSQASAFKGASSLISASPGVVQTLAVRCVSGDISIAPDVFVNKTKTTLARNGYSTVTGTATDNGQPLRIGNRFDSTTYLNGGIQYLGLWNRALLDSEILELSNNPWQIFKSQSRRIWVGAAGGTNTAVNPGTGSIAITGYAPSVAQTANQAITPNVGNIVITGYAPTISQPQAVNPGVGSLTITGYAPTVTQNVDVPVNPGVGTIAITGYAPTIAQTANQAVAPGVGNIVITGYAPTISQPQAVNPGAGTITITGYAPTVTQNVDVPINPGVGTIAITGYAPTVAQTANQSVLPATGTIAITGYSPAVSQTANQAITPDVGTITITGYAPIVQQAPASQNITPGVGTITITGYAPTVEQSSPLRLGGFEYSNKVYIKRNKKIYIFDSVEEADSYIEAEAKAEEIVQQSNKTSRLARKRAREKAFKSLAIEPVESVDIPALKTLVAQLQTDFELPQLIAQQDWQRVVEIYNQAMEMQDEEDLLLIL